VSVFAEAAAAARRIAAERRELDDPPPLDAAAWHRFVADVRRLGRVGHVAGARAAIDRWETSARRQLSTTSPAATPHAGDQRSATTSRSLAAAASGGGQPSPTLETGDAP